MPSPPASAQPASTPPADAPPPLSHAYMLMDVLHAIAVGDDAWLFVCGVHSQPTYHGVAAVLVRPDATPETAHPAWRTQPGWRTRDLGYTHGHQEPPQGWPAWAHRKLAAARTAAAGAEARMEKALAEQRALVAFLR